MKLRNINERCHDAVQDILSGSDKVWYQFHFDKFFSVFEYGFVGERCILLKDTPTEDCVYFLEQVVERLKQKSANNILTTSFADDAAYLRLCLNNGSPQELIEEFNGLQRFNPVISPMVLNPIYSCLIENGVIKENITYEYFVKAVQYAQYGSMVFKKNNMKYTIKKIANKYFPNSNYLNIAASSLNITRDRMSSGATTDSFRDKLDKII